MPNDAAHSSARSGAKQATTNCIARHTADDGTGGGALFLMGHAGAATQAQGSE